MSKRYVYTLFDAKTNDLLSSGTPQQLVEQGWYNRAESVCSSYCHQKRRNNKPTKWRLERRPLREKAAKAKPDHKPGGQMREVWLYHMMDADGKLLYEGTAAELVEKGIFKQMQDIANAFYAGHCRPKGIYSLTREKARRRVPCKAPGARSEEPERRKPPIANIKDPDALQQDVHELCLYNAAARKAGRKELSYGYWAAAGKPEVPA